MVRKMSLDKEEIYRIIPYDAHWRLLEHAEISPEKVEATVDLCNNPMCKGHFKGTEITPALLPIEAVGHAALLHTMTMRRRVTSEDTAPMMPLFSGLTEVECHSIIPKIFLVKAFFLEDINRNKTCYAGEVCGGAPEHAALATISSLQLVVTPSRTLKRYVTRLKERHKQTL